MVFLFFFFFFLRRPKYRRFRVFYLGPEVVVGRKRNHWPKLVLNQHPHRSKSVASHGRHRFFYFFALPSPALKAVTNRPISRSDCTEAPLNVINNLSDVSLVNSTFARNLPSPSPTPTTPPTPTPTPHPHPPPPPPTPTPGGYVFYMYLWSHPHINWTFFLWTLIGNHFNLVSRVSVQPSRNSSPAISSLEQRAYVFSERNGFKEICLEQKIAV